MNMYLRYHGLSMGDTNSGNPDEQNGVKHIWCEEHIYYTYMTTVMTIYWFW